MMTLEGYKEIMFQNPIQILNALMCLLDGKKDTTILLPTWFPIMDEFLYEDPFFTRLPSYPVV